MLLAAPACGFAGEASPGDGADDLRQPPAEDIGPDDSSAVEDIPDDSESDSGGDPIEGDPALPPGDDGSVEAEPPDDGLPANSDSGDLGPIDAADVDADGSTPGDADAEIPDAASDVDPIHPGFELVRVWPGPIVDHSPAVTAMVLFDFDGDGLTDAFVFSPGSALVPCLYRNVSAPGDIVFEPVEGTCGTRVWRQVLGAAAHDADGDGRDTLVVSSRDDGVTEWTFPQETPSPVGAIAGGQCHVATVDLDLDGDEDIYSWCRGSHVGRHYMREPEGWQIVVPSIGDALGAYGPTLTVGLIDVDRDGLIDIVRANDTLSSPDVRNILEEPGGVAFRCRPDERCRYREQRFAEGVSAWGSYMGVGAIFVEGIGELLYLTDLGPNRAFRYVEGAFEDVAIERGLDVAFATEVTGEPTDRYLFSWSALVDDFDHDGDDDIYVTNGAPEGARAYGSAYEDSLLVQRADGTFEDEAAARGVTRRGFEDSLDGAPYSARGAAKVDFDLDGQLDIVEVAEGGRVRFYTVVTADVRATWCTLDPRPRLAPGHGYGFEIAGPDGRFRRRDTQGEVPMWLPRTLLSSASRGRLRFPSGATVAFDCGSGFGPVRVDEPEWLRVDIDGNTVLIEIDWSAWGGPIEPVAAAVSLASPRLTEVLSATTEDEATYRVEARADALQAMVRIGDRWVGRWFSAD